MSMLYRIDTLEYVHTYTQMYNVLTPHTTGSNRFRTMCRSSAHLGSSGISLRLEESGLHGTQTQTLPATHERTSGQ